MLDVKKFSDYEEMFVESIKDNTVGELIDTYCRLDSDFLKYHDKRYGSYFGNSYFIDTRSLLHVLEKEFFHFISNQEGFKELPILGTVPIDEDDCEAYAVEKISDRTYKVIYYNHNEYYFIYKQLSHCTLEPSPYETIGDLYRAIDNHLI